MDKEIIERITKEVMRALQGNEKSRAPKDHSSPRVTMGSAGKGFDTVVNQPGNVYNRGGVQVSPNSDKCSAFVSPDSECTECGNCIVNKTGSLKAVVSAGASRIGVRPTSEVEPDLAPYIDHTLLKADASQEQIGKICNEAKKYSFASVCINPANVLLTSQLLKGSKVKVCTVVGFPLGATTPTVKAIEARDAIANGADEIDMVINVGALKSGNDQMVFDDIKAVRDATRGKVLKVILETALLTDEQKVKGCTLAKQAGADFVKTSTGFGPSGATVEDIRLMRDTVGPSMGVKASGGIRSREDAQAMVKAGATRIGASASVAIVTGKNPSDAKGKY